MTAPVTLARFSQLIEGELAQLRGFVQLLAREEALLVAGDIDALLTLTQEKTALHHQLQRQNDARAMMFARERIENSDAAIRDLCANMPETLARWDAILELGRDAQARNALNGRLINERMQHNQAALSVLLAAADQPQLYDAEGAARPTGRGRHLGSA